MTQELGRISILHVPAEKPMDAFYAIPSKGAARFLVAGDKNKPMRQIDFLRRLLADTHNAKCILILDNLVLDRGARMRQFLLAHGETLEIIETLSAPQTDL